MQGFASLFIRLLTHNIRYATHSPFEGELPWEDRRPLLLNELKFNTLQSPEAFICLQEVLNNQLVDIMSGLNDQPGQPEWSYIGVGRDDGKKAGEFSPIIYRPSIWKLEEFETVWLSETPKKPSKGWDAASVRILTVGVFQHKQSQQTLVGMSTHLDDQGPVSREQSAELILKTIARFSDPGPVFLGGDLNSDPSDAAFRILNGTNSPLQDVKDLTSLKYGNRYTFTGFDGETELTEIDHIFVGPKKKGDWQVKGYAVLNNRFDDEVYISDHRAVAADCALVGDNSEGILLHQDPS